MRGKALVRAIIDAHGFFALRSQPNLHTTAGRMVDAGEITRVAPGFYVAIAQATDPQVLLSVLRVWAPEAVLIGESANDVHRGLVPQLPLRVALRPDRKPPSWLRILRSRLPHESVVIRHGMRCASQIWLAVEAAARDAGERIFNLLREAPTAVDALLFTLTGFRGKSGNRQRNRVVAACERKPYSFAEYRLHQTLLEHGLDGWSANHRFQIAGRLFVADLYFPDARLIVEFDSWEFHSSREAFERDREKQLALATIGLTTIRITWKMLTENPTALIEMLNSAIRAAGHAHQFSA